MTDNPQTPRRTALWNRYRQSKKKLEFLSEQTEIPYDRLDRIIRGSRPTEDEALAISEALGVPAEALFEKPIIIYRHREHESQSIAKSQE